MQLRCSNRNPLLVLLVCILVLCAAGLSACSGSAPSPSLERSPELSPTPTRAAAAPLQEEWSADGIVKAGEYSGSNTYAEYTIYWRSDEQSIYVGMTAKTTGWVSVAIQPGSRMKDADIVLGFVKDGRAEVVDLYSADNFGPHHPDTELGGTNGLLAFGGREEGGYTTIEFKRSLTSDDKYDNSITKGVNRIIWAYGASDNSAEKHTARGYGEVDL